MAGKPKRPAGQPTARAIAKKQEAEDSRKRKLHAIGERRAKAAGLSKKDYIAEIVKGKHAGITPEEIDEEPDPGAPEAPEPPPAA